MYDYLIIGGGIIGLSVGMQLSEAYPEAKIAVTEKEEKLSQHQTGRNSGVIHSGVYYRPDSLKANFATNGSANLIELCKKYDIPYEQCGKLIVAVDQKELPQLNNLYKRGLENNISLKRVSKEAIKDIEPHVNALEGIHIPVTGIVDYKKVAELFAEKIRQRKGDILTGTKINHIDQKIDYVKLQSNKGSIKARYIINCAGLYSDKVAAMSGLKVDMKIVPFRGEYYELKKEKHDLVKNLIYPVPNPEFPFLGVHFTRMIGGGIHIGPNAVLSLKREGYNKTDVDLREALEVLSNKAFWSVAKSNMAYGLKEMVKSLSKKKFLEDIHRYFPQIESDDLIPAEAGVRAQALSSDGKLLDDFFIAHSKRGIHVCNAPSPAATASLEIGGHIVNLIRKDGNRSVG